MDIGIWEVKKSYSNYLKILLFNNRQTKTFFWLDLNCRDKDKWHGTSPDVKVTLHTMRKLKTYGKNETNDRSGTKLIQLGTLLFDVGQVVYSMSEFIRFC